VPASQKIPLFPALCSLFNLLNPFQSCAHALFTLFLLFLLPQLCQPTQGTSGRRCAGTSFTRWRMPKFRIVIPFDSRSDCDSRFHCRLRDFSSFFVLVETGPINWQDPSVEIFRQNVITLPSPTPRPLTTNCTRIPALHNCCSGSGKRLSARHSRSHQPSGLDELEKLRQGSSIMSQTCPI